MIKEKIKIKNKLGIHARPATLLAQEAGKFKSEIFIAKDGIEVNAKSIMGIMMIAAEQGCILNLTINGEDEVQAAQALKNIFNKIFEEE